MAGISPCLNWAALASPTSYFFIICFLSISFFLTECNRTYYGEVGQTYELSIPRPRADKLPFVCRLNFVANQYEMGDLVQVRGRSICICYSCSTYYNKSS